MLPDSNVAKHVCCGAPSNLEARRTEGQEASRPGGQEARRPGGQEARRPGPRERLWLWLRSVAITRFLQAGHTPTKCQKFLNGVLPKETNRF